MKSDRELLELAARAAGYSFKWFKVKQWKKMTIRIGQYSSCTGTIEVYGHDHSKPWNPLADDGDAFRLAVNLNLLHGKVFRRSAAELHDEVSDIYSSTRRAIVIAAASIGESMP